MQLDEQGFSVTPTSVDSALLGVLRDTLFAPGEAGTRCLLDDLNVIDAVNHLREELVLAGSLPAASVAVQAIAFDKSPQTNWKVSWHQDLMFPFASRPMSEGFTIPCVKDGIHFARPPRKVLDAMTAVRLHLDECDESNGPLRVSPGSHTAGILRSHDIPRHLASHGEATCLAKEGDVVLMKVLTLHASSKATNPKHRRVLHLVYYSGAPIGERWHRTV